MKPNDNISHPDILPLFADHQLQAKLIGFARQCLDAIVANEELPPSPALFEPLNHLKPGLFVTLTKEGHLRGCIGHIWGQYGLDRSLPELCRSAALADYRFSPVEPAELFQIRLELSILNPPYPIAAWRDIRVGSDGVVLALRGRQAVFLPQVATEQGWNLDQTLTALAQKAGLGPTAWRDPDCRFQVFQAIHFGEP